MHGASYLASLLRKELKQEEVEVYPQDCLCSYKKLETLPEIVVCHPDDTNKDKCWDGIGRVIDKFPHTTFYVFAYKNSDRENKIGKHDNLKYINERNTRERLTEIINLGKKD